MAFEVEQFGVGTGMVEPGFIRTNFADNIVTSKKAQDPNSPYSQMMMQMKASSHRRRMIEGAPDADLVTSVIVEAATAKEPKLRYLAGKDVQQMMTAKKSMSDKEFQKMISQSIWHACGGFKSYLQYLCH
jgi:NAD(P)-dependent dehydrogenase (short-subunit alcohol dehydrogenase family)